MKVKHDLSQLLSRIGDKMEKEPSKLRAYSDYFAVSKELMKEDHGLGLNELKRLSEHIGSVIPVIAKDDVGIARELIGQHRRVLLAAAPHDFDSFLQFVEWNRDPEKKFYLPRRKALKVVVDSLQALDDDKLDLLGISLPPGVGKSTVAEFYVVWIALKYPDEPSLIGSHSNAWVRGAYDEILRILDPKGEYLCGEVFPGINIASTNAKDCRIDLGKPKRFETLEFTSIGTGNAGLYRAMRLLYCDDLVSGREVALSKERLDKLWGIYTTDLRQRKLGDHCKELHIATRWSVHDVLGRLESEFGDNPRMKFITIPAMNEQDESNFDYPYGVGYSTKALREQREVMDDADWRALFMNQPIEREGLLYSADELSRYFELPDGEPDAIISVCDTKDRGSDDCVMPVAYKYGDQFYIEAILCDNSNPEIVDARLIDTLVRYNVHMSCFESNSAGGRVAQTVQQGVKERGGRTKIVTKYTTANKETKIIVNSPWVKEHCLFKDDTVSDREYKRAVGKLCAYTTGGKNKHDDVPDAFAQLAEYAQSFEGAVVEVFRRPW